jgi:hypothetical protein
VQNAVASVDDGPDAAKSCCPSRFAILNQVSLSRLRNGGVLAKLGENEMMRVHKLDDYRAAMKYLSGGRLVKCVLEK